MESDGRSTVDIPTKYMGSQNIFFIQHAPDASYARQIGDLQKFDIQDLIKDIKAKILQRSGFGIRGLARIFKAMDENGNKNLDVDDFRWGLMDYGISITKDEGAEIMTHFDRDKNGSVNFDEFLVALRVSIFQKFNFTTFYILG